MAKKIRVLVVDDSAIVRKAMSEILSADPAIEVIGTAIDPYVAAERMKRQKPDVITLDIEMPRMDGLTFLRKIMTQHPLPVVICSSVAGRGTENAMKALEYGAVNIITKPRLGTQKFLEEARVSICDAVKAAAGIRPDKLKRLRSSAPPRKFHPAPMASSSGRRVRAHEKVVLLGASTGGTEAIREFLECMKPDGPGIAIVQHMPEQFTKAFADRLNEVCPIMVKEARDGDPMLRGQALIAPGHSHLLLKNYGGEYAVEVRPGPLVSRHRPSVDVLFRSGARYGGRNVIGVILTGMGNDGAKGMKELHDAGSYTIAQNEETSVVYGMPFEAVKAGGVDAILPMEDIGPEVDRLFKA